MELMNAGRWFTPRELVLGLEGLKHEPDAAHVSAIVRAVLHQLECQPDDGGQRTLRDG